MKQIVEEHEKPFTSSLNICPEACCRRGFGRSNAFPLTTTLQGDVVIRSLDISIKDDVIVILQLDISFMAVVSMWSKFFPE
jgi:hypothetical protein